MKIGHFVFRNLKLILRNIISLATFFDDKYMYGVVPVKYCHGDIICAHKNLKNKQGPLFRVE